MSTSPLATAPLPPPRRLRTPVAPRQTTLRLVLAIEVTTTESLAVVELRRRLESATGPLRECIEKLIEGPVAP